MKEIGTGYSCGSKRGHRKSPSFQRVMRLRLIRKLARAAPSLSTLNLRWVHQNVAELGSKELQTSFSIFCPSPQSLQSIARRLQKNPTGCPTASQALGTALSPVSLWQDGGKGRPPVYKQAQLEPRVQGLGEALAAELWVTPQLMSPGSCRH